MSDVIKKKIYYSDLFNLYSNLLTKSTRDRLYLTYFEDLSLSEIAEKEGVSRNAIFLSIKKGEKELNLYENKLKLYLKKKNILSSIDKYITTDLSKEELIDKLKGEIQNGI